MGFQGRGRAWLITPEFLPHERDAEKDRKNGHPGITRKEVNGDLLRYGWRGSPYTLYMRNTLTDPATGPESSL